MRYRTIAPFVMAAATAACAAPVATQDEAAGTSAAAINANVVALDADFFRAELFTYLGQDVVLGRLENIIFWSPVVADRLKITRYSDDAYDVQLRLVASNDNGKTYVPLDAGFMLVVGCDWRSPSVTFSVVGVTHTLHDDNHVFTDGQRELVDEVFNPNWGLGKVSWADLTSDLNGVLGGVFAAAHRDAAKLTYCPQFTMDTTTKLSFDFAPGTQCANDAATKHTACRAPAVGNGYDFECRNGYWVVARRDCVKPKPTPKPPEPPEPKPPPGGAQP